MLSKRPKLLGNEQETSEQILEGKVIEPFMLPHKKPISLNQTKKSNRDKAGSQSLY